MKYLKVFADFEDAIEPINDAEAGRLFRAMLRYARTGETPKFSGNERYVWPTAKLNIDREAAFCEKQRRNAKKPNEAKPSQTEPNEAKPSQTSQKDKDKDKEYKETLPNGSAKKTGGAVFTPPTVDEVRAYCLERKNSVDPAAFVDFYTSKGWLIGKNRMKDWRAAVRTWERERTETRKRSRQRSQTFDNYDEHRDAGSVKPVVLDLSELDQDKIEAMF